MSHHPPEEPSGRCLRGGRSAVHGLHNKSLEKVVPLQHSRLTGAYKQGEKWWIYHANNSTPPSTVEILRSSKPLIMETHKKGRDTGRKASQGLAGSSPLLIQVRLVFWHVHERKFFKSSAPQETEEADESKSCVIINLCFSEQWGKRARRRPATCRRVKNARLGLREEPSVLEARALCLADMVKKASLLCKNLIYKHPGVRSTHSHTRATLTASTIGHY